MKKLQLALLFSSVMLINSLKSTTIITDMGPLALTVEQGATDNTNNIVSLGGTVNLGDGTNIIVFNTSNITYPAVGTNLVLGINSSGHLVAGEVTQLGTAGDNEVLCPSDVTGDITLTSKTATTGPDTGTARNIQLLADGNIKFFSTNIATAPSNNILMSIDTNNNVVLSDAAKLFIFGNATGNYVSVDNSSSNPTGIILDTSAVTNSSNNIKLHSGLNNINFAGANIDTTIVTGGTYNILGIDTNGNVGTFSATSPIVCGNLTAAGTSGSVTLGVSGSNAITLSDTTGTVINTASGYSITLSSGDHLIARSSDITTAPSLRTVLAVDGSNNVVSSDLSQVFVFGSTTTGENYIKIDNNATANGIVLSAQDVFLSGNSSLIPAPGYTNVLTLDSTGKIGIVVSSETKKEDIKALSINDDAFYALEAVSYRFKDRENSAREYGFIAEKVAQNEALKSAVIYDQSGNVMSINYNAIFTALTAKFIETRKQLVAKTNELESQLYAKDEVIANLQNQINELKSSQNYLAALIQSLIK